MNVSIRTALMVIAALSASSVAPAQVAPGTEPLLAQGSTQIPAVVIPAAISVSNPTTAATPAIVTTEKPADVAQDADEVDPGDSLEDMVASLRSSDAGSRELECLAVAIYFESKSEPLRGQLAVGHVVADRAASGRFPSSYCGVLFQRSQFSFVRGNSYPSFNRSSRQWQNAVAIAKIVDEDLKPSPLGKALFFHATHVSPRWRLKRVGTVGRHVFYR